MAGYTVRVRPPLGPAVKLIILVNAVIYLGELAYAYAVGFDAQAVARMVDVLGLSAEGVRRGWVWQLATHMWIHDPDRIFHIVFNLLVLYFFGLDLEARWGTRRFVVRYFVFGAGAAAAVLGVAFLWPVLFGHPRGPALGASGAISGLVAAYCIQHWRTQLRVFFLDLSGRGLLLVFIVIDIVRVVTGSHIAVEAHWGGMLTAAALLRTDLFHPRLLRLRFKRWRLKRRLRLERGGDHDRDSSYLH